MKEVKVYRTSTGLAYGDSERAAPFPNGLNMDNASSVQRGVEFIYHPIAPEWKHILTIHPKGWRRTPVAATSGNVAGVGHSPCVRG